MLTLGKLRNLAKYSANKPISKLKDLQQRWRNWQAASISNRIIFFAISLTMMIVIIISVISYSAINILIRQNINANLESQTQLLEQSIQFALNDLVQNIADLSANSLVTNGLLDSQGREIYLLPFLRDQKMPVPVEAEITLSDFQGAPIASNQHAMRSYTGMPLVKQAIETGKPQAEILRGVRAELLLVQPVFYPATGHAEGAIIARVDLQEFFEKASSFAKLHKHFMVNGTDLIKSAHHSKDENLIQVSKRLRLAPPLNSLNLEVMIDQQRGEALALLNWVTFIYLAFGAGTLWLVLRLARTMARRLTLPLSALSQTASQIAASGSLKMKAKVTGVDEVGNLGAVFNQMLNKLDASHELLELRVTERTQELKRTEQRLSSILESVRDIIRSSSLDGKEIIYLNEAVESVCGRPPRAFFENPGLWMEMIDPEDRQSVLAGMLCVWEKAQCELTYRIIRPSGERRWLLDREQIIYDEHNNPIRLDGIVTDITERKQAEEALHQAHQSLKALIQTSPLAVYTYDLEGYVTMWNPAATRMFGWTEEEVIGRFLPIVREDKKEEFRALREKMSRGEQVTNVELIRNKRDGSPIYISVSTAPLYDAHDRHIGIMAITADITERKATEERIRHLAEHDFLTGLPNRVMLRDRLNQAIAREHHQKVGLLFLDLDRFKNVNDSLGHHIGDKLLQLVGERLKSCVRAGDTVSRQGGDEFVIMMPDIESAESAARAAEKLLDAVAKPYFIDGHDLGISTSIGISLYPDDGLDLDTLLKNTDAAMYHAKERGRNNYQFFAQDMNVKALERLTLQTSLRRALERGEFLLHYQAQIDIVSERIVGMEALIRWQHPEFGLVPPGKFIPIAEDSGLIMAIGEWVLYEACRQNKKWQADGLPRLRMAVNLSAHQFRQYNLIETVAGVLAKTGLDAHCLELELTESLIMQHVEENITTLEKLSAMGVQISIDDFGTGYSSLSYLKRFPIDRLKIDQSFVRDITVDPDDAAINSAIIAMAKSLKLKVIAEGVESREQLIFLRRQGCDEAQGYYFSKPLPAEKFAQLLISEKKLHHILSSG